MSDCAERLAERFFEDIKFKDFIDSYGEARQPEVDDMVVVGIYYDEHPRLAAAVLSIILENWDQFVKDVAEDELMKNDPYTYYGVSRWNA